ncbi:T-cell surface antigen CD2-like isoform X2 [Thunnus albacares]|uniref:T-cell surface antigen CD2-like isoform X2 n=1 Tax=Thunnus albacares TaxID=8236 RepID=UPI001CF69812|nr:T-cell surface antigen CD2-like isoform X2 [Thunnus albacares]
MEAVVGLLVMLLGVSHGVETYCDGRQNRTQCYGALGGTVVLQLMNNASEILGYQWNKNKTTRILNGRKDKIEFNKMENRSVFTPSNGTFKINNLIRTDGAEYTLIIFDSNGVVSEQRTLQLSIQAPVSSVLLDSKCLSQGEMRVSCSSEGADSPQYSWTLDGHTLTDIQLLSGNNETNNITLKQDVSGRLVCSVRNHVSNVSKEEKISTCGFIFINCTLPDGTNISQWVFSATNTLCIDPTTTPTMITDTTVLAGVLSALVILLMVGVAVVCRHRKKQNNKPKEEDDQELTYADVNIMQRPGRQMHQKAEMEVEYDQVKFSGRPQQTTEMEVEYGQVKFSGRPRKTVQPKEDECVYAKVRNSR